MNVGIDAGHEFVRVRQDDPLLDGKWKLLDARKVAIRSA
jgi:hypothetical protein